MMKIEQEEFEKPSGPSQAQAKSMLRVFVITTILGMIVVFANVTLRSYAMRKQFAEQKQKEALAKPESPSPEAAAPIETPKP